MTLYEDKDFSMIDVIHPSITKGSTLSEWAALRNIAGAEILAIGDNHNDLEMLSFAGMPVVMGEWCAGVEGARVARDPVE